MQKIVSILAVFAAVAGVAATAALASSSAPTPNSVTSSPELRVSGFYHHGPDVTCDSDSCSVNNLAPIRFRLPDAAASYGGTLTISLAYTTAGDGWFALTPRFQNPTGHAFDRTTPWNRVLQPVKYRDSTSLVFHVQSLPGDVPIELSLGFAIYPRHNEINSISTTNVSVDVRLARGTAAP
jgi:hypothetical protein